MNYVLCTPATVVTAHCGLDLNSFRTVLWSGKELIPLCFVDSTRQRTMGWLKAGHVTQEPLARVYSIQTLLCCAVWQAQGLTLRMSSRKAFLFPPNGVTSGPLSSLLACTLSSLRDDRHRANTASPFSRVGKGRRLESSALLLRCEIPVLKHTVSVSLNAEPQHSATVTREERSTNELFQQHY